MSNRFVSPFQQFVNSAGVPYSGGLLYFYLTGTSTKSNTYTTAALGVANANPVVLDSAGRAIDVFLDPAVTYKVVLAPSTDTDPPTAAIATADPVVDLAANVTAVVSIYTGNPNTHVAGSQGALGGVGASIVWDSTNQVFYVCTTTGTATTAVWTSIVGSFASSISFTGVITPTQISANTNDWAPAGFSSAYLVRISSDAARNLTGIAGGATGREIMLANVGTFTITLVGNSGLSTAANRLLLDTDISLLATEAISFNYDVTSQGWRAKSPLQALTVAAQSDQETATSTTTAVSPGRQQFHPSAAKCVALITVAGGTPTLQTPPSYNITSIADTGVGLVTITIATDFSSANWAAVMGRGYLNDTAAAGWASYVSTTSAKAAGSIRLIGFDVVGSAIADPPANTSYEIAGFGDQ